MTEAFCTLAGRAVAGLTLVNSGAVWYVDVDLEDDGALPAGKLALVCQGSTLTCSVDPEASGVFGLQRRVRVIAGGGGWSNVLAAKDFQTDGGVKARTVADDTARAVGETIGDFLPAAPTLADRWTRARGSAGASLEVLGGGVPWWVDYTGLTHVRARPVAPLAGGYEVLNFNPRTGLAQLAIDDLTTVRPGSVLTERLEVPQTVQSIVVTLTASELRAEAVLGTAPSRNVLEKAIEAIVTFFLHRELQGLYRYRVIRMASDGRVDLQAVRKGGRVPDALLVPQGHVPGGHALFREGAIVSVAFHEGDRQLPAIVAAQGLQGSGYVPRKLFLGGTSGASEAARKGDAVRLIYPPTVITGTMLVNGTPTPFTGVNTSMTGIMQGVIDGGSPAVSIGSGS